MQTFIRSLWFLQIVLVLESLWDTLKETSCFVTEIRWFCVNNNLICVCVYLCMKLSDTFTRLLINLRQTEAISARSLINLRQTEATRFISDVYILFNFKWINKCFASVKSYNQMSTSRMGLDDCTVITTPHFIWGYKINGADG